MAAQEIQIAGTNEMAKIRDPVTTLLLCIFVPFYSIYWYYSVNKEMAAIGQARGTTEAGDNPTTSVLAVTLGALACLIPSLISIFNSTKRLEVVQNLMGTEKKFDPPILFLLFFVVAGYYFFQESMNQALQAQAGGAQQLPPQPEQPAQQQAPEQQEQPPQQ
jgi:hypothetical protein